MFTLPAIATTSPPGRRALTTAGPRALADSDFRCQNGLQRPDTAGNKHGCHVETVRQMEECEASRMRNGG
jgi:hypothetical protein